MRLVSLLRLPHPTQLESADQCRQKEKKPALSSHTEFAPFPISPQTRRAFAISPNCRITDGAHRSKARSTRSISSRTRIGRSPRASSASSLNPLPDFLLGGHSRTVVALAKVSANAAIGCRGVLAGQEHGHHARMADSPGPTARLQGARLQTQHLTDRLDQYPPPEPPARHAAANPPTPRAPGGRRWAGRSHG